MAAKYAQQQSKQKGSLDAAEKPLDMVTEEEEDEIRIMELELALLKKKRALAHKKHCLFFCVAATPSNSSGEAKWTLSGDAATPSNCSGEAKRGLSGDAATTTSSTQGEQPEALSLQSEGPCRASYA